MLFYSKGPGIKGRVTWPQVINIVYISVRLNNLDHSSLIVNIKNKKMRSWKICSWKFFLHKLVRLLRHLFSVHKLLLCFILMITLDVTWPLPFLKLSSNRHIIRSFAWSSAGRARARAKNNRILLLWRIESSCKMIVSFLLPNTPVSHCIQTTVLKTTASFAQA